MNPRRVLAGAGIVLLVALAVWRLTPAQPSTARSSSSSEQPAVTPDDPPTSPGAPAARGTPSNPSQAAVGEKVAPSPTPQIDSGSRAPRTTEALLDALHSKDDFVVVDAADDLVSRKETRALPALVAFDIKNRAHAAPTVIDALGRLAGSADPASRRTSTDRLIALLAQEKARNEPESAGNVLGIYAALGQTLDPRAAATLEAELLDPNVRLAAKTVIVEALVRLKQPSSSAALRTLEQQIGTTPLTDKMEEDIRRELLGAIQRALRVLP